MAADLLPEALWEEIESLLPPVSRAETGRPPGDNMEGLRGIIFVLRFNVPWQAVSKIKALRADWSRVPTDPRQRAGRVAVRHRAHPRALQSLPTPPALLRTPGEHFQALHELAAALLICSRITSLGLSF
ncbi:MAG: transposase [Phycisphaerales bacterium]|nr:transposase [Phycisphaerales bacterium]